MISEIILGLLISLPLVAIIAWGLLASSGFFKPRKKSANKRYIKIESYLALEKLVQHLNRENDEILAEETLYFMDKLWLDLTDEEREWLNKRK